MADSSLKTRLRGISLIFACGTALFSDGYANGIIGSGRLIFTRIYGKDAVSIDDYNRTIPSLGYVGTVVGMLLFGFLSDRVGRKFGMVAASWIVVVFSALSAVSSGKNGNLRGLLGMLSVCRFFLGIGVGAEYPSGSVAASEQSEEGIIQKNAQHRWLALATNSMIDIGFVVSAFIPLVLFWILGDSHLRAIWRISLGLGVAPALTVFFWRYAMDEPVLYKSDSIRGPSTPYVLILRRYGVKLAAISFVWCYTSNFINSPLTIHKFSLFSSAIINDVTGGSEALSVVFGWSVVIYLFYIPGTIGGAFVVDRFGPRKTLMLGFTSQAVIGFIMSGLYKQLTSHVAAFAVVYGIFLSLGEVGPGNCTFVLASKSFPTAVRGQCFGVAAAVGKIGAFIGTWAFPPMINAFGGSDSARGNTGPFWVGSGLSILGALVTFFFIELDQKGMVNEDKEFRKYLEANGYDTSNMGLKEDTYEEVYPMQVKRATQVFDNSAEHTPCV
ncbi:putative metabolite transporter [Infundibulicybe gibba]|nr:putative metabolite transporter [Infundibulicybe gibba]